MKYNKAVECDFCGEIQVSVSKGSFSEFIKNIQWIQVIHTNGHSDEFCCIGCKDAHELDMSYQDKLTNP